MTDNKFNKDRQGSGTREWSEHSYNIQVGCGNGCVYCFATDFAINQAKYVKDKAAWLNPVINEKKASKKWPEKDGVIMFPTAHDIDKNNLEKCIQTLRNMLTAGNDVLIVSKPDHECIQIMVDHLKEFKKQILFRFTIGSIEDYALKLFEPFAPNSASRQRSLKTAYEAGYKTSISVEPLLGGIHTLAQIYECCAHLVTDDIWVGKMNKIDQRIFDDISMDLKNGIRAIKHYQADERILEIYDIFNDTPKNKWKDSIKKVVGI